MQTSSSFCFLFLSISLVLSLSIVPHHHEQIITRCDCVYGSVQNWFLNPVSWELQRQQPEINLETQDPNHWILCCFSCRHFQLAKPSLCYLQLCDRADGWVSSGFIQSDSFKVENPAGSRKSKKAFLPYSTWIYQRRWDLTFEI